MCDDDGGTGENNVPPSALTSDVYFTMIDEVYRRIDKFWQFSKQIAGKQSA